MKKNVKNHLPSPKEFFGELRTSKKRCIDHSLVSEKEGVDQNSVHSKPIWEYGDKRVEIKLFFDEYSESYRIRLTRKFLLGCVSTHEVIDYGHISLEEFMEEAIKYLDKRQANFLKCPINIERELKTKLKEMLSEEYFGEEDDDDQNESNNNSREQLLKSYLG